MSAIPRFEACIVCDIVRPELNGKLILLGFIGICPNVEVGLLHIDQAAAVTFVLSGGPGDGTFSGYVTVVDESDQRVVAETTEMPFTAQPNAPTTLAPTLLLTFGRPGAFSVRLFIEDAEQFRGAFRVVQAGTLSQVRSLGNPPRV